MNSVLRIVLLAFVCAAATGVGLLIINTLINILAPCYWTDTCQKLPITGTLGYILDVLGHVVYFAIFPLGAIFAKKWFRKLFSKRRNVKIARWAFALIPVIFFPLKYALQITLF